jgi:hypothetical protein
VAVHDVAADRGAARTLLEEYCRQLAGFVGWAASVGDDAPRFGLLLRDRADGLVEAARRLDAHGTLSDDAELAHRVAALARAAARAVTDPAFTREVVAAGHDVAERGEDVLGVVW